MEFDDTDRMPIGGDPVSGSVRLDFHNPVTGQMIADFTH